MPDRGAPILEDVLLDDDVAGGAGTPVAVLYEGETDPAVVYHAQGDRSWVWIVLLLAGSLGYLAYCTGWLVHRAVVRRRPQHSRQPRP